MLFCGHIKGQMHMPDNNDLSYGEILSAASEGRLSELGKKGRTTFNKLASIQSLHGNTALHLAVMHGHLDQVSDILKPGERVTMDRCLKVKDGNGATLVHDAAFYGQIKELMGLMAPGEKLTRDTLIHTPGDQGASVMHGAAKGGHINQVTEVVEETQRPSAVELLQTRTNNSESVAHYAAANGNLGDLAAFAAPEGPRPSLSAMAETRDWKRESVLGDALKNGHLDQAVAFGPPHDSFHISRLKEVAAELPKPEQRNRAIYGPEADGGALPLLMQVNAFHTVAELKTWRAEMPPDVARKFEASPALKQRFAGGYARLKRRQPPPVRPRRSR